MKRLLFAMLLDILLFEHAALLAQSPTGTIVGRVIDPAGAHITILNPETGLSRTVSAGVYSRDLILTCWHSG
jgi:hypothetical protein